MMLLKNFDENGKIEIREIPQNSVSFEDLKVESMINFFYGIQSLLVGECELEEKLVNVGKAIELFEQYEKRSEVNELDEFLRDSLGKDAHLFTSDGK